MTQGAHAHLKSEMLQKCGHPSKSLGFRSSHITISDLGGSTGSLCERSEIQADTSGPEHSGEGDSAPGEPLSSQEEKVKVRVSGIMHQAMASNDVELNLQDLRMCHLMYTSPYLPEGTWRVCSGKDAETRRVTWIFLARCNQQCPEELSLQATGHVKTEAERGGVWPRSRAISSLQRLQGPGAGPPEASGGMWPGYSLTLGQSPRQTSEPQKWERSFKPLR